MHSLRYRLFLTLAGACLLVAIAVAGLSRRAAHEILWSPDGSGPPLELHEHDAGAAPGSEFELHRAAQHGFDRSLLIVFGAVAFAALVGTALLTVWIVRPLERLTRATDHLREKGVPVEGRGEVAQLATRLNDLAADLARTEELRRRLLQDVGHELRTPLTAVRGKLEAMQDGLLQASGEELDALHADALHLGRVVDDLQEISLAEAGGLCVEAEPLDSAQEIAGLLARAEYTRVESELEPVGAVLADRARLRQILTNLLDNALRHTPAPGRVWVTSRARGSCVEIGVHDEGAGITASDLPHVFERFYRTDPARDRRSGGAGLGLAIARHLAVAQRGTLSAESEPGKGSVFRVRLPRAGQGPATRVGAPVRMV